MSKQQRRIETEQRLVDSAWSLLVDEGIGALGVNAVAARAGVDKVLIYRYFGGLEGLLEQCGERADFWPTADELLGGSGRPVLALGGREAARAAMRNYVEALRRRPATLAVLRSECVERNPLTIALERVREERTVEAMVAMEEAGLLTTGRQRLLSALFGAAVNYLLIRGPDVGRFGGADIGTEAGWEALVDAMADVLVAEAPR